MLLHVISHVLLKATPIAKDEIVLAAIPPPPAAHPQRNRTLTHRTALYVSGRTRC